MKKTYSNSLEIFDTIMDEIPPWSSDIYDYRMCWDKVDDKYSLIIPSPANIHPYDDYNITHTLTDVELDFSINTNNGNTWIKISTTDPRVVATVSRFNLILEHNPVDELSVANLSEYDHFSGSGININSFEGVSGSLNLDTSDIVQAPVVVKNHYVSIGTSRHAITTMMSLDYDLVCAHWQCDVRNGKSDTVIPLGLSTTFNNSIEILSHLHSVRNLKFDWVKNDSGTYDLQISVDDFPANIPGMLLVVRTPYQ